MVQQIVQADREMSAQLEITAKKLEQFYAVRGHLPNTREERELFQKVLGKYIIDNPFHPQVSCIAGLPTVTSGAPSEQQSAKAPHTVPVFWLEDKDLDHDGFAHLVGSPDDSWRWMPGTILILTNGKNTYLICAMSEDSTPMKNVNVNGAPPYVICKEIISVHRGRVVARTIGPAIAETSGSTQ